MEPLPQLGEEGRRQTVRGTEGTLPAASNLSSLTGTLPLSPQARKPRLRDGGPRAQGRPGVREGQKGLPGRLPQGARRGAAPGPSAGYPAGASLP